MALMGLLRGNKRKPQTVLSEQSITYPSNGGTGVSEVPRMVHSWA